MTLTDLPLVSIVIPNYNCSEFLHSCLESAIAQDYKNTEIIVVDDGSTDKSLKILEEYRLKIKIISTTNFGASAARKLGILQANGKYIALLDSDDIWLVNKISKQMEIMNRMNVSLVYSAAQEFGLSSNVFKPRSFLKGNCYDYFKKYPGISLFGSCSGIIFDKSIISLSGNFDTDFLGTAEDWDFFRRFCKFGEVAFSSEILFHYRKHSKSITARPIIEYYRGNRMAILKMLREDAKIKFFERRFIWSKLHWMFFKSFVLRMQIKDGLLMLLQLVLPIR